MLIANNCTRQNGQFMGDQLCYVKIAYMMVENSDADRILMTMSPDNEMAFVWQKFIDTYNVEVIYDNFDPGDNTARWAAWDEWRSSRSINGNVFEQYRELYLRIHGVQRQTALCGAEIGKGNIYEYVYYGQEHKPTECVGADWFDDSLFYHPERKPTRDVYIAPHCKTQGNITFTFDYWSMVVRHLIRAGVSVTVGFDGSFCDDLQGHPLYRRHWGTHEQWFEEVCQHKIVVCGNTGTGWVSAACGVPLITMEPHNSVMADHRYRQCGLRNIVEVIDGFTLDSMNNDMVRVAEYCANKIIAEVQQVLVMTTGCYDILHAGHIKHLERSRALGTKLVVALNSDSSVRMLKGETRPVNTASQRKAVLEALRCVDEVRVFDGPDAKHLVRELKPDVLTVGYGYKEQDIVGRELVGRTVVTCTDGDVSTTRILKKLITVGDTVEICRQAAQFSVNPLAKLCILADHLLSCLGLYGSLADVGTYKGGSAFVLSKLAPGKPLHLFDTWTGTPYDDDLCHHKTGSWQADITECVVEGVFHVGIFPASAVDLVSELFCFVFVDTDTYQSVKDAIAFFWPRMVYGGKIVFDDYGWEPCAGVKKALHETFSASDVAVVNHMAVVTKR